MFKIAICDDEPTVCTEIERIIMSNQERFFVDLETEVFFSGEKLLANLKNKDSYELIFLDIEMNFLNGVQAGLKIREELDNQTTQIAYVSGTDSYYRELFDVRPMRFINKPIDPECIIEAVSLAVKLNEKTCKTFTYKKGFETYKIAIKDILYFESANREIIVVSTCGTDCFYGRIDDVFSRVEKFNFLRIHKSYLINYAYVSKFKYEEVLMSNLTCLPISQARRKEIKEKLVKYEKEEL